MKRGMIALLATFSMAALVAGGCASNETVKKEEAVEATVKQEPAKSEPAKTEVPKTAVADSTADTPKTIQDQGTKASDVSAALETVYFDFDKSDLRKDARDVLNKNAEVLLKAQIDAKIQIEGNCDERGSAEYNLALGERRAKSAMQYLITLGVKSDRISVISYGKEKPAVDGHDEAAWAKNRRGDFVIIK